jgi:hypothetical protein
MEVIIIQLDIIYHIESILQKIYLGQEDICRVNIINRFSFDNIRYWFEMGYRSHKLIQRYWRNER